MSNLLICIFTIKFICVSCSDIAIITEHMAFLNTPLVARALYGHFVGHRLEIGFRISDSKLNDEDGGEVRMFVETTKSR